MLQSSQNRRAGLKFENKNWKEAKEKIKEQTNSLFPGFKSKSDQVVVLLIPVEGLCKDQEL